MTDQQIVGRDPIAKTIVESFTATYPTETDEQIFDRIVRASRSAGDPNAEIPLTLQDVAYWRSAVTA